MDSKIKKIIYSMLFGNGASIILQLLSVPVFIATWGVEQYAEWILLSTIPGYLSLADFGTITFSLNKIQAYYIRKRTVLVNNYIDKTLLLIVSAFTVLLIIIVFLLYISAEYRIFTFNYLGEDYIYIAILLVIDSLINVIINFYSGLFRLNGKYHFTINFQNFVRLMGVLVLVSFALNDFDVVECVIYLILFRFLSLMFMLYVLLKMKLIEKQKKVLPFRLKMSLILGKSLSLMFLPISNIIYLNFSVMIVAAFTNSSNLILYNTMRTMTRFSTQFIGIFGKSWWAEVSKTSEDGERLQYMYNKIIKYTLCSSACVIFFGISFGEWIYSLWLGGKVEFDFRLFLVLLVGSCLAGIWTSIEVLQLATNNFSKYSKMFFMATLIQMILGVILSFIFGFIGMPISTIITGIYVVLSLHNANIKLIKGLC